MMTQVFFFVGGGPALTWAKPIRYSPLMEVSHVWSCHFFTGTAEIRRKYIHTQTL